MQKKSRHLSTSGFSEGGDYLLFRFRSTIGVIRFNFSVRNGKRWNPRAIDRLSLFADGGGDGRPFPDGVPRRSMR